MAGSGALGRAIRARLDRLGLPARRFTAAGYISAATLSRVFAGQDGLRDPSRVAELERGLGWRQGSVNAVREGRSPLEIRVSDWPRADGDWRTAVEGAWVAADEHVASVQGEPSPDLAALIDFLFTTVHAPDAPELTYDEIARRVREAGRSLTSADLEALRAGHGRALERADAQALAGAFGVPTSYFYDPVDAERVRRQLTALATLRRDGVERIALRSAGLSDGALRAIEDMVEHLRSLEDRPTD